MPENIINKNETKEQGKNEKAKKLPAAIATGTFFCVDSVIAQNL